MRVHVGPMHVMRPRKYKREIREAAHIHGTHSTFRPSKVKHKNIFQNNKGIGLTREYARCIINTAYFMAGSNGEYR